jgi:hypothetical protein
MSHTAKALYISALRCSGPSAPAQNASVRWNALRSSPTATTGEPTLRAAAEVGICSRGGSGLVVLDPGGGEVVSEMALSLP